MRTALLLIDAQVDFCHAEGALAVPGAPADTARTASLIRTLGPQLHEVHATLDSHHPVDISHPSWWRDAAGQPPPPFTPITAADMAAGRWTTAVPARASRTRAYLHALEAGGGPVHMVWPEHCIVGTPGHALAEPLRGPLAAWARQAHHQVQIWRKGENPWSEHFSAVRAAVPDPDDPSTGTNEDLLTAVSDCDRILVAGQALSHCVAATVRDLITADPALAARIVLLEDATSPVAGFEQAAEDFLAELRTTGATISTTYAVVA
jgi:nicotinamidase-related amidase